MNQIKKLFPAIALMATMSMGQVPALAADINVIPIPVKVSEQRGEFTLPQNINIQYNTDEGKAIADYLANKLKASTGYTVNVGNKKGNVTISINPKLKMHDEGYQLQVTAKGVNIKAKTGKGAFYGMQTFLQLLPAEVESANVVKGVKWVAQCCNIDDYPRFGYRGFHLDPCRHFITVENVKKQLDLMASLKVNTMHFHLTEDQGWRIEIKKYPKLTEIGSKRTGTITAPQSGEYDSVPVSGYYTQEEAREIVRYAAERYITVIPEIDMPGHMQAALASYNDLGCTGGPYEVCRHFGVIKEVMCAGKPQTLQFAKDVINEIMDIFPSPYIHIGGDECPKERWKECERCQAKIAELGLKDIDGHSKEEQLQTWFMDEVAKEIRARGRKMIGWDEILEGTPSKDVTVIGWTSPKATVRAAKAGHPTVIAPIQHFYFSNVGLNKITGIPSIERVYNLEPYQDGLTPAEQQNVIGAEGCIWTEWVKDAKKMEWELLPRLAALCEVQWTQKDQRNLDSFLQRMLHIHDIYRLKNLNYKEDIEAAVKK